MEHINSHIAVKIANRTTREKPVWGHKPGKQAYDLIPRECFVPEDNVGVPVGACIVKRWHGTYWGDIYGSRIHDATNDARALVTQLQARGIEAGMVAGVFRSWTGRDGYGRGFYDAYQDFRVWARVDGPVSPWPDEKEREFFEKYLKP